MSDHIKAKEKAKAFTDIRNRDVEARGAYDPRFDTHPKSLIKDEPTDNPVRPVGNPEPESEPGKAETPPTQPVAEAPPVETVEPVEFDSSQALYYGDSIATGLGHNSQRGTPDSDAHWGRGAAATLSLLNNRPDGTFRGRDIVLSTGVLNSGPDWDTVRAQVKHLQERGARSIRLVGVPNTDQYAGWNDQFQTIADETGVTFLGGYTPGSDGVHFDYPSYPTYRQL